MEKWRRKTITSPVTCKDPLQLVVAVVPQLKMNQMNFLRLIWCQCHDDIASTDPTHEKLVPSIVQRGRRRDTSPSENSP